ncbi:hypothetical protein [Microbacterium sp. A84]|uniref:hypothetical protein n=1 Tax=Microbacterium sp. A84 TaxID=3450715 RepID=UPI003F42333F
MTAALTPVAKAAAAALTSNPAVFNRSDGTPYIDPTIWVATLEQLASGVPADVIVRTLEMLALVTRQQSDDEEVTL